jgi:nucleotide-binding universal stress UspA family protein
MARNNLAGAPIVVGIDGSHASEAAVRLAVGQAVHHHRPLLLVHALESEFVAASSLQHIDGQLVHSQRIMADAHIAEAVGIARTLAPALAIDTEITTSTPASALVQASQRAAVVVVGTHGRNSASGLVTGSTAVQVATHADCPVIISRGESSPIGDVVLGIDGSPTSASAVAFAFDTAAMTDTGVHAVHAWHRPIARTSGDSLPTRYTDADVEAREERLLAEAVSGWADKYPEAPVRRTLIRGAATRSLLDASAGASMLVVGARGLGGFSELLLGSVGLTLMHRSMCPIAIVRPGAHAL